MIRTVFLISADAAETLGRKGGGSIHTESLGRAMCTIVLRVGLLSKASRICVKVGHCAAPHAFIMRIPGWEVVVLKL